MARNVISRRSFVSLAAGLGAARAASAQTKQELGRKYVHDALAALGGDAFLAVHNQVARGRAYSFYNARVRGLARITVYDLFEPMQPNADRDWLPVSRREVYTEKGDYYALFKNGKSWEVTFQGARPFPEDLGARYRESVRRDFFYFLRYRLAEPGLYYYAPGMEIVDNLPTNKVEITDAEGETLTVYLRQSDGLPHMAVYLRRDPKTRIPFEEKSIWSNYRLAGGAKLPWNIRKERDGEQIFEQFASSVEANVDLKREIFDLPRGIKLLDPDV